MKKMFISRRNFLKASGATAAAGVLAACGQSAASTSVSKTEELGKNAKWTEEASGYGFNLVTNEGGKTLGYSPKSGLKLLQVDGLAFKDVAGTGELLPYADWRLSDEERAADLASRLSIDEIAGLMCFSAHQRECPAEPNDTQKSFLDGNVRAVLNAAAGIKPADQITWANAMQQYVEGKGFNIPINFSSDPRNGQNVSNWPGNLALAATFDPDIALEAGKCMARELRDLGIGTFLGPQVDIASDPRWQRFSGTFGEDPALAADMTRALIDGLQSTYSESGEDEGWGKDSVLSMVKHWPAEGPGEGGREAHKDGGKYAVYPNDNFMAMTIPFVDGAFNLNGKTGCAAEVMSSYTIAWSENEEYGELVGSGFSEFKIQELLRENYGYTGAVCTDWSVLNDPDGDLSWRCWGLEDTTKWNPSTRATKAVQAGVDQMGGLNDAQVVVDAYNACVELEGEAVAKERFTTVAARLLKGYFALGLFENPYIMEKEAAADVNSADKQSAAMDAQIKGIVMLKNHGNVIQAATGSEKKKVYVPMRYLPTFSTANAARSNAADSVTGASCVLPLNEKVLSNYFEVVTDKVADTLTGEPVNDKPTCAEKDITRASAAEIADCDFVLVVAQAPKNYDDRGGHNAEGEWVPLSVQYRPYTADNEYVRKESLAGDTVIEYEDSVYGPMPKEVKENRSYYGHTSVITNEVQLDQILDAAEKAKKAGIPCIVMLDITQPMCVHEFEDKVDAILVSMSGCTEAACAIISGQAEPSGLLPMQMPKDMLDVEKQAEDLVRDMECYTDADGHKYDFAFGMNYSGVISDARTAKYSVAPMIAPNNMGK